MGRLMMKFWTLSLTLTAAAAGDLAAQTYLGPSPYLSRADSPYIPVLPVTFLDDFEDNRFDMPGVTGNGGIVVPGPITDSVDADDGLIDGFGTSGHTYFTGNGPAGLTFNFDATILGGLPTSVGVVWTDGEGNTSFEAFDASGASLGVHGPFSIADNKITGETAEDRFFGIDHTAGISAINIRNTAGGIEIDHLQFYAPGFLLTADQHAVAAGDPLILTTSGGMPGGTNLLAAVDVNGTPTFTRILISSFDSAGISTFAPTVPAGLSGLVVELLSIGFASSGTLQLSNIAEIDFL